MDKRIVGTNAGKVWCALKEIGEISIPELARRLNLSVESTALAAGWLARENKICIQRKNGLIALSEAPFLSVLDSMDFVNERH